MSEVPQFYTPEAKQASQGKPEAPKSPRLKSLFNLEVPPVETTLENLAALREQRDTTRFEHFVRGMQIGGEYANLLVGLMREVGTGRGESQRDDFETTADGVHSEAAPTLRIVEPASLQKTD